MEKRKEVRFSPEEQIDFVKLIDILDWTKEITPICLVKAANKVAGLKGKKKYGAHEVSYGLLVKSFEARVSRFTDTKFRGKDRFYTLKKEFTKDHILHYARTGEILEIKKELERKDSKFYTPTVSIEPSKPHKREFPDDEAYMKAAIVLGILALHGGSCSAAEFVTARKNLGWKYQRSIRGKLYGIYQEANEICTTLLDKESKVILTSRSVKFTGDTSKLEANSKDICSLIVNEDDRKKVINYLDSLIPKTKAVEVVNEQKEAPKPQPKQEESNTIKPKSEILVIATSPEQGRSEFQEIKPITPPFENSKTKWYKSLVASTMIGATRGTYFNFNEVQTIIRKTRFVDMNIKDIREIINNLSKQKRGIIREIDLSGFTIGSEVMCQEFYNEYLAEKITETIFIRLHMSLDDIQEMYPNLLIKLASEITPELDNIFEIEMNRGEKAERDFAKLLFRIRPGEIVLESPNNWTIRRAKIVMEKLGFI